jgi:hypothetical protein
VTRDMLGGINKTFFVPDARETRDGSARHVIAAQDFVERYGIRSVFGMGGAYFDGTLAATIAFTSETMDAPTTARFPSLIGNRGRLPGRSHLRGDGLTISEVRRLQSERVL